MIKNNFKIILVVFFVFLLAGCSLGVPKKTELSLKNEEKNQVAEDILSDKQEEPSKEIQDKNETMQSEEPQPQKEEALETLPKENIPSGDKTEEKKEETDKAVDFKIKSRLVSWGFQKSSGRKIDTVIIHSSYNSLGGDIYDLDKILDIYKSYGVSPHYIIARNGQVYRLVEDKNIAYHAGESKVPDGRTNVNGFSVGIEIVNSKTESPSEAQYENLKKLIKYLKDEHDIKYVLGHSDIASGRKDDPWKFDWNKVK